MAGKTSQLQIRVSPAQKAALKRLAADAELSVSAFVLARALPPTHEGVDRRVHALGGGKEIGKALSDLQLYLEALEPEEFDGAVTAIDQEGLTDLQLNCAAAAIEGEAWRRERPPPSWTADVPPLARPYFSWSLPSLRPHLMRVAPAAFKRRNLYLVRWDDPRR